jgi:hypothetical protein
MVSDLLDNEMNPVLLAVVPRDDVLRITMPRHARYMVIPDVLVAKEIDEGMPE